MKSVDQPHQLITRDIPAIGKYLTCRDTDAESSFMKLDEREYNNHMSLGV